MPRKITLLRNIIHQLDENNFLVPDLIISLKTWQTNLNEGKFHSNAQTQKEAALRVQTMLGNIGEATQIAESWVSRPGKEIDPNSEAGLRARLSDEIAWCLRKGGIILPDGQTRTDVPQEVIEVIYQLKPDIKQEVEQEIEKETRRPALLEGSPHST